jgi:hypothetical protein
MKKLLLILVCCSSVIATSQEMKRENVNGKIIVEGGNIEGITIYNTSLNLGVVTNKNGEFTIPVDVKDLLEIRFLEYQNFDVIVNEAILESKKMNIFLIEEVDKLDDVLITNKKLTGNMKADLTNLKTYTPKMDAMYFGIKNSDAYALSDANKSQVEIVGMPAQDQILVNGLNVVNVVDQLLIPLFRSEVKDKKAAGVPEVPAISIKYYLGSNFLVENFNIPEYRVEEFIRYVEDDEFDFDLLNYGHELELLQLISTKSKTFLNTKSGTD